MILHQQHRLPLTHRFRDGDPRISDEVSRNRGRTVRRQFPMGEWEFNRKARALARSLTPGDQSAAMLFDQSP